MASGGRVRTAVATRTVLVTMRASRTSARSANAGRDMNSAEASATKPLQEGAATPRGESAASAAVPRTARTSSSASVTRARQRPVSKDSRYAALVVNRQGTARAAQVCGSLVASAVPVGNARGTLPAYRTHAPRHGAYRATRDVATRATKLGRAGAARVRGRAEATAALTMNARGDSRARATSARLSALRTSPRAVHNVCQAQAGAAREPGRTGATAAATRNVLVTSHAIRSHARLVNVARGTNCAEMPVSGRVPGGAAATNGAPTAPAAMPGIVRTTSNVSGTPARPRSALPVMTSAARRADRSTLGPAAQACGKSEVAAARTWTAVPMRIARRTRAPRSHVDHAML